MFLLNNETDRARRGLPEFAVACRSLVTENARMERARRDSRLRANDVRILYLLLARVW